MNRFQNMGVGFVSLTEALDTTTPGGILVFNIFASLAQFERDLIRERTNAGLEAARSRGRIGGRPTKLADKQIAEIQRLYDSKTVTVNQIAAMMNIGRATVYRALKRDQGTLTNGRRKTTIG